MKSNLKPNTLEPNMFILKGYRLRTRFIPNSRDAELKNNQHKVESHKGVIDVPWSAPAVLIGEYHSTVDL